MLTGLAFDLSNQVHLNSLKQVRFNMLATFITISKILHDSLDYVQVMQIIGRGCRQKACFEFKMSNVPIRTKSRIRNFPEPYALSPPYRSEILVRNTLSFLDENDNTISIVSEVYFRNGLVYFNDRYHRLFQYANYEGNLGKRRIFHRDAAISIKLYHHFSTIAI